MNKNLGNDGEDTGRLDSQGGRLPDPGERSHGRDTGPVVRDGMESIRPTLDHLRSSVEEVGVTLGLPLRSQGHSTRTVQITFGSLCFSSRVSVGWGGLGVRRNLERLCWDVTCPDPECGARPRPHAPSNVSGGQADVGWST